MAATTTVHDNGVIRDALGHRRSGNDGCVVGAEGLRGGGRSTRARAPRTRARGRQVGTWTWDQDTGKTIWDARLEAMHGMEQGSFGGTYDDWLASLHPDDRDECVARVGPRWRSPARTCCSTARCGPTARCTGSRPGAGSSPTTTARRSERSGWCSTSPNAKSARRRSPRQAAEDRLLIQSVQRALLPVRMPEVDGVEFAARYESAPGRRSGATGTRSSLPHGRLGVAIGDVAGHGLAAVAEMAHIRFRLRSLAYLHDDPGQVSPSSASCAGVLARHDGHRALRRARSRTGCFEYALAGHFPPVLCGPDSCRLVEVDADPPLGLGERYTVASSTSPPTQPWSPSPTACSNVGRRRSR